MTIWFNFDSRKIEFPGRKMGKFTTPAHLPVLEFDLATATPQHF